MSLATWFRKSSQAPSSPRVQALLEAVVSYLKNRPANEDAVPKFIAKAIGESEMAVTTALRLLEEAGVAKQWFGVFCSTRDIPLGRFDTLQKVPKELPCIACDEEHCLANRTCKVEVFYTIDREKLAAFNVRAVAA